MQIKSLILSTLLAVEAVSAASHKHSSSQSKSEATSVVSVSTKHSSSSSKVSSSTKHSSSSSKVSSSTKHSSSSSTTTKSPYEPGKPWSTLTPSNTYQCGFTDFSSSFGIAVRTVTLNETTSATQSSTTKAKRDLIAPTQAVDVIVGQVRAVASPSTTSDSDIKTTTLTRTKTIVSTSVATLSINSTALNETAQYGYNFTFNGSFVNASFSNISFYGNSSIANSTYLNTTAFYLNQSHKVNTTSYNTTLSECSATLPDFFDDVSCQSNTTLAMTLKDGILRDSSDKIGSIVSSHQFQFNGPWPAEGSIYAAGWSITPESLLSLGDNDIFYECLSGDGFYNLYDEFVGSQCIPIQLEVVSLIDC